MFVVSEHFRCGSHGFFVHRVHLLCDVASAEDCYWTVGRSVLVGNSMELNAEKKWLAIDGRLRTVPKDNRSFGMFWSLTRTQVVNPTVSRFLCLHAVLAAPLRVESNSWCVCADSSPAICKRCLHGSPCQVAEEANVLLKQTSFEMAMSIEGLPAKKKMKAASRCLVA